MCLRARKWRVSPALERTITDERAEGGGRLSEISERPRVPGRTERQAERALGFLAAAARPFFSPK